MFGTSTVKRPLSGNKVTKVGTSRANQNNIQRIANLVVSRIKQKRSFKNEKIKIGNLTVKANFDYVASAKYYQLSLSSNGKHASVSIKADDKPQIIKDSIGSSLKYDLGIDFA